MVMPTNDGFTTLPFIVRDALAFEAWIQTWESNEIEVYYHGVFDDDQDNIWIRGDDDWFDLYRQVLPHRPIEVRITHIRVPTAKFLNDVFGEVESEAFFDELSNYLYIGECVVWHTFKILTLPHPFNPNIDAIEHMSTETMGAITYTGEWHTQSIRNVDDTFEFSTLVPLAPLNFNLIENLNGKIATLEKITYYPDLKLLEQAISNVLAHYDVIQPAYGIALDQWMTIGGINYPGLVISKPEALAPLLREYNKLNPWLPLFTNGIIELYPTDYNFTTVDEDTCIRLWFKLNRRWSCPMSAYNEILESKAYQELPTHLKQLEVIELDATRDLVRMPLGTYEEIAPMVRNIMDDFVIKGVNHYYMSLSKGLTHEPTSNNDQ